MIENQTKRLRTPHLRDYLAPVLVFVAANDLALRLDNDCKVNGNSGIVREPIILPPGAGIPVAGREFDAATYAVSVESSGPNTLVTARLNCEDLKNPPPPEVH